MSIPKFSPPNFGWAVKETNPRIFITRGININRKHQAKCKEKDANENSTQMYFNLTTFFQPRSYGYGHCKDLEPKVLKRSPFKRKPKPVFVLKTMNRSK